MSDKTKTVLIYTFCVIGLGFILLQVQLLMTSIGQYKERKIMTNQSAEVAAKALAADNLKEFLNCKYEPGVCERLYPDAAKTVKKAIEDSRNELK